MKKKNILLITIILLCLSYFGYKGFNIYYYNINNITTDDYENFREMLSAKDTITLKNKLLEDNNYLVYNNVKIRNDFNNFLKDETIDLEDSARYKYTDEKGKNNVVFQISQMDTYVEILKSDKTFFGTDDKRVKNFDFKSFLEKNNITTDIQLFEYLSKNNNKKNNIFTPVKEMKKNYSIQLLTSIITPVRSNLTVINGDYEGYIFTLQSGIKEVNILKNNKRYIFLFIGSSYFTDKYVTDLLQTIVID